MRLIILRFHYILHLASAFILLSMLTTSSLLVMMTLTIFPGSNLIYTTSFRQKVWGRSNIYRTITAMSYLAVPISFPVMLLTPFLLFYLIIIVLLITKYFVALFLPPLSPKPITKLPNLTVGRRPWMLRLQLLR